MSRHDKREGIDAVVMIRERATLSIAAVRRSDNDAVYVPVARDSDGCSDYSARRCRLGREIDQ